jgi:hypothetical protein
LRGVEPSRRVQPAEEKPRDALARLVAPSIEHYSGSILVVRHAREIVAGVYVLCPTEEELFEGLGRQGPQRINDAAESNLDREPIRSCAQHRRGFEF